MSSVEPEVPDLAQPEPIAAPRPVYTYVLLGSLIAVFIAQIIFGGGLTSALVGDEFSALAAGFVKQYFVERHEYWRILTGATVHGGIVHILMNGYALLMFGRLFEMLASRAHMAIVFLLSCICGGLLSLYFLPDGVSVGASGGIVGLLGYITVYAFRRRKFISYEFRKSLVINIAFLFFFGLVLFNVVDNFGHLGGLIAGVVYGFIQIPSDEYVDPRAASTAAKYIGEASLLIFVAAGVLSIFLIASFKLVAFPR
jgi:membrane associated rhomboid family serine protease